MQKCILLFYSNYHVEWYVQICTYHFLHECAIDTSTCRSILKKSREKTIAPFSKREIKNPLALMVGVRGKFYSI